MRYFNRAMSEQHTLVVFSVKKIVLSVTVFNSCSCLAVACTDSSPHTHPSLFRAFSPFSLERIGEIACLIICSFCPFMSQSSPDTRLDFSPVKNWCERVKVSLKRWRRGERLWKGWETETHSGSWCSCAAGQYACVCVCVCAGPKQSISNRIWPQQQAGNFYLLIWRASLCLFSHTYLIIIAFIHVWMCVCTFHLSLNFL